ncbi:MAG: HEPN domain-containing protein [Dehalococcoidia bacterium]|nr:HEPN domain-containing protein [Dehalococcoidia bacterium]
MEEFRDALRSFVVEACKFLAAQPIGQRQWIRIVRIVKESVEHTSFPVELRPDFSEPLFHWTVRLLVQESMPSFRRLVDVVRASDKLRGTLLVDDLGKPTPDESHKQLLFRVVWRFMNSWVNKAKGVQFDERTFQVLWDDLVHDIESPTIKVTKFSPLFNLELDSPEVTIDAGVRLFELPAEELESLLNANDLLPSHPLTKQDILRLRCAVEVVYEQHRHSDQSQAALDARNKLLRLMTAVRLLSEGTPCVAFTRVSTSSWLNSGTSWESSPAHWGANATIRRSEEPELIRLFARLTASPNASRVELALGRWNSAGDRSTEADRLIDHWVALESLFGPRDKQELSFRMPLRIAAFLGADGPERQRIFNEMRDSYDLRSKIVHGSDGKSKKTTLSQSLTLVRSYLKRALLKILLSDEKFDAEKLEIGLLSRENVLCSKAEFEGSAGI